MKHFFGLLKTLLLPLMATVLIVLALLVGVARLLLPQVPQYQGDIQRLAEQATGFQVDFGEIGAGISRYGPELRLQQTRISLPEEGSEVVYAEEVKISLDVAALILHQTVLPSHTEISGVRLNFIRDTEGRLLLQGRTLADWVRMRASDGFNAGDLPDTSLWLNNVSVGFDDQFLSRPPTDFRIDMLKAELDDGILELIGLVKPELRFGEDISFLAEADLVALLDNEHSVQGATWSIEVNVPDLDIGQWVGLLPDEMSPVSSGTGAGFISASLRGGLPLAIEVDIDLQDVLIALPDAAPIVYERVAGEVSFERDDQGWLFSGRKFVLQSHQQQWPAGRFDGQISLDADNRPSSFMLDVDFVNLNNLMPLGSAFARGQLESIGFDGQLGGHLDGVRIRGSLINESLSDLSVRGTFTKVSYVNESAGIDIAGVSGNIDGGMQSGQLKIDISNGRFQLDNFFREAINTERLNAQVFWSTGDDGLLVETGAIELQTPYGTGSGELSLFKAADGDSGWIVDFSAVASSDDVTQVIPNMPTKIPAVVLDWLEEAVLAGEVNDVRFRLLGDLSKFPYTTAEEGVFSVMVPFQKGALAFAPGWPQLENLSGELVFDGLSMFSTRNEGAIAGTAFSNINAQMPDMRDGILTVDASVSTGLPEVLRLLRESTISNVLGPILNDVTASGDVSGAVNLYLPVNALTNYRLNANLLVSDAMMSLRGIDYPVTEVNGPIELDRTRLSSKSIDGRFLGQPVSISLRHPTSTESGLTQIVEVRGETPMPDISAALRIPLPNRYTGSIAWEARALFPTVDAADSRQFEILVESDLQGLAIDMPAPLFKTAGVPDPLTASVLFPAFGVLEVLAKSQSGISGNLRFEKANSGWALQRGALNVGALAPKLPEAQGLAVSGTFGGLSTEEWFAVASEYATTADGGKPGNEDFLRELDIYAEDLQLFGYHFPDSTVSALQVQGAWNLDIDGPRASGSLTVPADLTGDKPLRADMSRLVLQSDKDDAVDPDPAVADDVIDPRDLPSLSIRVADFVIDEMSFGKLDASVLRTDRGLKSERIVTSSDTFNITIDGDWIIVDPFNLTPRTRLSMNLESTDVAQTLSRLGYDPLVVAKQGVANADLTWNGLPGSGMIYESKGTFGFRVENGQVLSVEPGGGRLLGLLSFSSLPRRLSLDFSDVFDDGLGFDKLMGSFSLDEGLAYTCDVSMDGSVTDMAIIGSSNLFDRQYDQLVVVRPHMSNVIPLGTAVVAGPVIGAAVWLVSAIFKEPLSSIGETYYNVTGGWSDPQVNKVKRKDIDTNRFKNCKDTLPDFSEEDLAALRELKLPKEVVSPIPEPSVDKNLTE